MTTITWSQVCLVRRRGSCQTCAVAPLPSCYSKLWMNWEGLMSNNNSKLNKSSSGTGQLFDHEDYLDDVKYDFKVFQKYTPIQSEMVPVEKDFSGNLQLVNKQLDLSGKTLNLLLEDGKKLTISIFHGDYLNRKYPFMLISGHQDIF